MAQDPKFHSNSVTKHALTISETFEYYVESLTPEELDEPRRQADEIGMTYDSDDIDIKRSYYERFMV